MAAMMAVEGWDWRGRGLRPWARGPEMAAAGGQSVGVFGDKRGTAIIGELEQET